MNEKAQEKKIDFSIDKNNLHREEAITDLKVGSIRRLIPIKPDGTEDESFSTDVSGRAGSASNAPGGKYIRGSD